MLKEISKVNLADSPIATISIGMEGEILFLNKAAIKLLGQVVIGENFNSFISDEPIVDVLQSSTAAKLALDEGAELKILKLKNGSEIYISIFCSPAIDQCKTLFIRDIDARIKYIWQVKRQLEMELLLRKSNHIQNGNLNDALNEIAITASKTIQVARVNIWEIDEGFLSIRSLINYDERKGGCMENLVLYRNHFPNYFNLMQKEEVIITEDAQQSEITAEIKENYLVPLGILSMLDIPIRIEGKMMGIICFEDTNSKRVWDISEQTFAISVAQIIAQTIETNRRQKTQIELENALAEKKVLLSEINHRVKNNFSLINELIHLQELKSKDDYHKNLFKDLQGRVLSMTMIHRQLYLADNLGSVNFRDFLIDLVTHFRTTFSSDTIEIATLLDNCKLKISKAVLCGLIINELLTNTCRTILENKSSRLITLQLSAMNESIKISVSNTMQTVDPNNQLEENQLIQKLVNQIGGTIETNTENGTKVTLNFSIG